MAGGGIRYWDPWATSTTSSSDPTGTDTSTTGRTWYHPVQTATSSGWYPQVITKRVLVPKPKKWTDKQSEAYVRLVNYETKTGWKVTMIISGDILVTDPNIEKRKMEDFIPLLKENANSIDIEKINKFFAENPIK